MLLTIDGRGFLGPSAFRTVCWFKNQLGERAKYGTSRFIDPTKWRYYDANY